MGFLFIFPLAPHMVQRSRGIRDCLSFHKFRLNGEPLGNLWFCKTGDNRFGKSTMDAPSLGSLAGDGKRQE